MGTNYYFHKDICPHCGRPEAVIHIGKSSCGWRFSFQGYRACDMDTDIVSFNDWKEFIREVPGVIKDEYDREISLREFCEMVKEKQSAKWGQYSCWKAALAGDKEAQRLFGPWYTSELDYFIDEEGYEFSYTPFS